MCFISNYKPTSETLENTEMDDPSRPQNANVKDKLNMAVEIRDPRDVSTILRVLFFMAVCVRMKKPVWNHVRISFF